MMAALASAAAVAGVAWAGRAFVTWIRERHNRLEKLDALEHEAKLERERREGGQP